MTPTPQFVTYVRLLSNNTGSVIFLREWHVLKFFSPCTENAKQYTMLYLLTTLTLIVVISLEVVTDAKSL